MAMAIRKLTLMKIELICHSTCWFLLHLVPQDDKDGMMVIYKDDKHDVMVMYKDDKDGKVEISQILSFLI